MTNPLRLTSADGTPIAFERSGSGPALILVDAAAHYRGFSSFTGLVPPLAPHFTVHEFDRRGRGDSGDTPPYDVEREVEDLAALIDKAGGSAAVHGFSSGALLALLAAAAGLPITRMTLLEPPFAIGDEAAAQAGFTRALREQLASGGNDAALELFLADILPEEVRAQMRQDGSWAAMAAVAPTLVHDSLISEATTPDVLARASVPTLVLDSRGSTDDLTGMAADVAALLPDAQHRSLPGTWHGVPDDVLAEALLDFLSA
ncbi:MAG TPA: alpha/beta hydrolase [Nocardioides sp.]|nr:alpha/beta hydrolase [Nocardioides sp.]